MVALEPAELDPEAENDVEAAAPVVPLGQPSTATYTFTIDWNDGTANQTVTGPSGTTVSHVFTASGSYTPTLTATDASGNSSTASSLAVSITAVALESDP